MKCTIIGCGGAGINIARRFMGKNEEGFAQLDAYFVDTSRSNLTKDVASDRVYLFEGLDGSGKLRVANYDTIAERSKEMLQAIKPQGLVVLVHSAGGGSGSVIGPVIASELLKKEVMLVVACVGSSDSRIEAENTIKTLKSYAVMAERHKTPVNMIYAENSAELKRGAVDKTLETNIVLLSLFFSGENREIDTSDLRNFLNYTKVTSYPAALAHLDFFSESISLGRDQSIISAVTLTDDATSSSLSYPIEYQAVGFLPEKVKNISQLGLPLHMVNVANYFHSVVDQLSQKVASVDEARQAVVHKTIVGRDDNATDLGIVL
jgi:hypothetical protein